MAQIVDINRVIPRSSRERTGFRSTRVMRDVLTRQGQIEPLQVTQEGEYFVPFACDVHADGIVYAALDLNWPTLLVVVTDKYEN